MTPSRCLHHLTWPDLRQQALRRGSTVLWPFGAIEQHGPHLPLATDGLFAEAVCEAVLAALPAELPIWRLPLQSLGFSVEHLGFPGTLSLPAEILIQLVVAVGGQLAQAGMRRLVLLNGHGGQISALDVAARELRRQHPSMAVFPCFLWRGPEGIASLIPEPERSQGLHAGLAETSLMLHLFPDLVRWSEPGLDATGPKPPLDPPATPPEGWSLEGDAPTSWRTLDLSRDGIVGDPSGATVQLGAELFARLVEGWRSRLEALLRSDWPSTDPQA
ncbi:MAG: creatininase family protein [Synechococcaceae cyanobacterium]|jgi:creatinine amidohydrolase